MLVFLIVTIPTKEYLTVLIRHYLLIPADFCLIHQHGVPGAGIHDNVSIRVEQKESLCEHELLWFANISSALPPLGAVCFLTVTRQLSYSRHIR